MSDVAGMDRAGAVAVDVFPDGRQFGSRLRREVMPEAKRVGRDIAAQISAPIANEITRSLRQGLTEGVRGGGARDAGAEIGNEVGAGISAGIAKSVSAGLASSGRQARSQGEKVGKEWGEGFSRALGSGTKDAQVGPDRRRSRERGAESGGAFADGFRVRVDAAIKALPKVTIGVARNEAEQAVKEVAARLQALSAKRVGIDIDAGAAMAELALLDARLGEIGASSADIQVHADTASAQAQLAAVLAAAAKVAASRPTITVDADTGAAVAKVAAVGAAGHGAGGGISSLIAVGALIAPVIVPAAAAAVAALVAIGPAAFAGVAGVGVLTLALSGAMGAVKAMGAAEDQAGQAATSMAGRHAQVAAAADQVRSAEAALANTRINVAEATERAAEQAAEASERAARQIADAQRDLSRAEADAVAVRRELTEAQADARRAATEARQAALREIADLNASAEDTALAQRQATLDVAAAKAALDKVLADPNSTKTQREQAQINYDRQVNQQEDLSRRAVRLREDLAKADRKGVEGSDRVRAARERVAQVDERVADARRKVAEATQAAERQHNQAARAAEQQRRQGAYQIAQATQAVTAAVRAQQQATVTAGATGSAAMGKLQKEMAALSPEGRRFATFIFGLRGEFGLLKKAAEAGLLPGLQRGIEALLPFFPQLVAFVSRVAEGLGRMFESGLKALTSPYWKEFFGYIAKVAVPALETMFAIGGNVARTIASLILAFAPMSKDIGGGLVEMTARWAEWAAGLENNPGFQRFLAYVREVGPHVVDLIGLIVKAVARIVEAAAPIGAVVLVGLRGVAAAVAAIPVNVLTTMIGLIITIIAVVKIWTVVQAALNLVMALNPIGAVILIVIAFIAYIVILWRHCETFRTIVTAAWEGIQVAAKFAWENILKPTFAALVVAWGVVAAAATWLWRVVLEPAFRGVAAVVLWAWDTVIKPALAALRYWLAEVVAPVVLFFWHGVIKPAWQGIQLAIKIAWTAIQVIFGLIQVYIKVWLAPLFTWLYEKIIKPVFSAWVATVKATWELVKPVFVALGGFITEKVVPAFQAGVSAVGKAWDKILAIVKAPIKAMVNIVINQGVIDAFNWIASKVGVTPIAHVTLPKGFARGGTIARRDLGAYASGGTLGVLSGYTPGRDVHRFYSASGGALDLSGGEAVMRPEFSAALGVSRIDAANLAARTRGISGVRDWLLELLDEIGGDVSSPAAGYVRARKGGIGFADGGILPGGQYLGAFDWGGIIGKIKKAWDAFTDPVGTFKSLASKFFDQLPGSGKVRELAIGTGRKMLDGAASWLASKVGLGPDVGFTGPISREIGSVQAWIRSQHGKPYVWAAAGPRGYDCSGLQSAAYNLLQGKSPYRHTFSTHIMERIFAPGRGAFTVGWAHAGERGGGSVGHTAGNLAGLPFESRGGDGVVVGPGATKVTSFARLGHMPGLWRGGILPLGGVYDGGGYLPEGLSLNANYSGRPEAVLSPRQEQDLRALAAAGAQRGGGGMGSRAPLTIEHYHESSADPGQVAADLDWRMRGGGS